MEQKLSGLIDGRIFPDEGKILSFHLGICSTCQRRLRLLRGLKKALGRVYSPPLAADLREILIAQVPRSKGLDNPKVRAWGLRPAGLAVAAFAVAAVVLLLNSLQRSEEIPIGTLLLAHNRSALGLPLSSRELILSWIAQEELEDCDGI
jgi:anti-sigma factor RsiW